MKKKSVISFNDNINCQLIIVDTEKDSNKVIIRKKNKAKKSSNSKKLKKIYKFFVLFCNFLFTLEEILKLLMFLLNYILSLFQY